MTLEVSRTGRKVRKDSLEFKIGIERLESALLDLYVDQLLSTVQTAEKLETMFRVHVPICKVYDWVDRLGVVRSKSEAVSIRRSVDEVGDQVQGHTLSVVDGMLLGDGCTQLNSRGDKARLCIGSVHKECAEYYHKILSELKSAEPFFSPAINGRKGNGSWEVKTPFLYSLAPVHKRWYPDGTKHIPDDVRIDRESILLWYIGDGSTCACASDVNSRRLYFATNCFDRDEIRNNLCVPMEEKFDIRTRRVSDDNRLFIESGSIPVMINLIGPDSPVECFAYKFEIEEWRYWTSMKKAAQMVGLDYFRLANWVKNGRIDHNRSPGGKKVMFTDVQLQKLVQRVESGELPREKGKWHKKSLLST